MIQYLVRCYYIYVFLPLLTNIVRILVWRDFVEKRRTQSPTSYCWVGGDAGVIISNFVVLSERKMIICILPGGDCSGTSFLGKVFWTQLHFSLLFTQKLIVLLPMFPLSTYISLFRVNSNYENDEKWVSMKHVKASASVFVSTRAPDANT